MKNDIKKWITKDGEQFLKKIGIKEGQVVLDFGCGEGHYTIPAAKIVGEKGKVYALDKDILKLSRLNDLASLWVLGNTETLNQDSAIPIQDHLIDIILCYDVIHYQDRMKRTALYNEIHRVLKNDGVLSVYPKHYKQDYPLDSLADMEIEDIVREIERSSFKLKENFFEVLLHDDYYNKGIILNFIPVNEKCVFR
jgi:ubiquinone/menaquinone biosynthesis C-methylase UbiE